MKRQQTKIKQPLFHSLLCNCCSSGQISLQGGKSKLEKKNYKCGQISCLDIICQQKLLTG